MREIEQPAGGPACLGTSRRRQIATSYQDGLGIGAVIGLIQFVRSASGRG
jgi:hypothetical protein